MKQFLSAVILAVFACACDGQDLAAAKDVPAAKTDKPSGPEHVAASPAADSPVKFTSLSGCLETCEAPGMIATNRATCRLNCDGAHGAQDPVVAGGSNADPIGVAAACLGRCYISGTAQDACANDCKHMAASASPAPAADVLGRLEICVRTCHADKSVLPTNQATCELNCTQVARVAGRTQPTASP